MRTALCPSVFLGEKTPLRKLPVSLANWGNRKIAEKDRMDHSTQIFTWKKKLTFMWAGDSYKLTSASSWLWLFPVAGKTCLDSSGHGHVTKSGHSRTEF